VDPQKEGVFWQLRSNLSFDVLPNGLHEKLLMNKKEARKIVIGHRFKVQRSGLRTKKGLKIRNRR
jgi:hypothetical protein